ncbi:MAG: hypothetical protein AB3N13_01590 [Arenibacterium sp.]
MPEFDAVFRVADLDGTNGYAIRGETAGDLFGRSVAGAGDVNDDGAVDFVIGEPGAGNNVGAGHIFFGGASQLAALDAADGSLDGTILAASLNGTNGFSIIGNVASARMGFEVDRAGDVDQDGFADILLGAPQFGGGYAVVISSFHAAGVAERNLADLNADEFGWRFLPEGPNGDDRLGSAVSGIGDVNGDGIDDILLGARDADPLSEGGDTDEGAAYVIFGGATQLAALDADDGSVDRVINLTELEGSESTTLIVNTTQGDFGYDAAAIGDINGDGFGDFAIGEPFFDTFGGTGNEGALRVVLGRPESIGFADPNSLTSQNGTLGFNVEGLNGNDRLGRAVDGGGDINGDGFDDFIVGAPFADHPTYGDNSAGIAYVIFGRSVFRREVDVSQLDGKNGFAIIGARQADYGAISVDIVGDVNGDGFDDAMMSAHFFDTQEANAAGASFVIFGKAGGFDAEIDVTTLDGSNGFRIEGETGLGQIGRNTGSALGDVNQDGFDDILIGAEELGSDPGSAYIVFGHKAQASVTRIGTDLGQTINGGIGDDVIRGKDGNDTLIGHEGDDRMYGGAGNDILDGGSGDDELRGGSGNDRLIVGFEDSYVRGGGGRDTIDLAGVTAASVNLQEGIMNISASGVRTTVIGIEDVQGSAGQDVIIGSARGNILVGRAASDVLSGGGGGDRLEGGGSADTLNGGSGNDTLIGGSGRDELRGGDGADVFVYKNVSDSQGKGDSILDFGGNDKIDLSIIDARVGGGNQAFFFGGEGKLTGAAGQLKYRIKDTADGTFALVSGDTDGDGSADIKIRVFGETTLTAGDFIL